MLEPVSKRRQDKTTFLVSSVKKKCLFLKSPLWMSRWAEQNILLSSTKTEWKCTRAAKRSLMKILKVWWYFRSSKCWNLFLSVDRLKPLFSSHLWKLASLQTIPHGWITEMNRISCSLRLRRSRSAPGPQKEFCWRYWMHGDTSEVVNVGTRF